MKNEHISGVLKVIPFALIPALMTAADIGENAK